MRRLNAPMLIGLSWLLAGGLFAAAPSGCGSTNPCDISYTGGNSCTRITAAIRVKCGAGTTFDCAAFFGPECKLTEEFCSKSIDKCASDITASADCAAAGKVTCNLECFAP